MTTLENYVERNMLYGAFSRKLPEPSGIGFCAAMAQNRSLNTALATFFFGNPIAHHNFIVESFCTLHLCSEIILDAIFFFGTPNVHHMFIRNSYCTHVWLGVLPVLYITNSVELT